MPNTLLPHLIAELHHRSETQVAFKAVTLFLDISGFTPLTEALMQQGKHGAERLAEIVNDTFHPLITTIYAHGGYISGFAGDAFTAIFSENNAIENSGAEVLRVAAQIQALFRGKTIQTPQGSFPLAVKLGVAYGLVQSGLVGLPTRRAYYYRGPAIDACAQAERYCHQGDIVVTPDLAERAGVMGTPIAEGFVRLVVPPADHSPTQLSTAIFPTLAVESATAFYPRQLLETPIAGEFRQLASVFVAFRDLAPAELDMFAHDLLREVDARDGYFNRLDFGDKGGNCLIFFGAPTAHENDVTRALQLALFLRETYREKVRVGVTFGPMYFGRVGIPERCEITALGNAVNFSARLMMKAPWGEVWVAPNVAQQSDFSFTALGAFPYKGFAAPVPTFALQHQQTAEEKAFAQPMVGREAELAQLVAWLRPLFEGQFAGAVAVYGDPGMGKSRLTFALRETLGERVVWLSAPADEILRQAFNPFAYALQRYFGYLPAASPEANRAAWEAHAHALLNAQTDRALRAELEQAQSFLGALAGVHWPGSLYDQMTEPKLRYDNTRFALKTWLIALARLGPVVLEIDDAHWLDDASRDVLNLLTRQIPSVPIALVFNSRYQDDGTPPPWPLEATVPHMRLELRTLTPEALRALGQQELGGPVSEALLALTLDKTQGNPFFAQQFWLYLQENQELTPTAHGEWDVRVLPHALPLTVSAILVARIDRLNQHVKQVVQTAAVLGREFEIRLLTHILRAEIGNAVSEAERGQIWSALSELRYLFKHALLREAAYEMQLRTRLRELHGLAVNAYERLYAADPSSHYDQLAYHAERSEDVEKQRLYFRLAGEAAQKNYANHAALSYYERLLPLLADANAQIAIHLKRGMVLVLLGRWDEAEDNYRTALQLASADLSAQAGAQWALGKLNRLRGKYTDALNWLTQARHTSLHLSDQARLAQTLIELGRVEWQLGNYTQAHDVLTEGLALARTVGDKTEEAWALNHLGLVTQSYGDLHASRSFCEASLVLRQALGDKWGVAASSGNLASVLTNLNDPVPAQALLEKNIIFWQEIGEKWSLAITLHYMGDVKHAQADYATAEAFYKKSIALKQELNDQWGIGIGLIRLGELANDQEHFSAAQKLFEDGLALSQYIGKTFVATAWLGLALAYLGAQHPKARATLVHSLRLRHELGERRAQVSCLIGLAGLALQEGHPHQAAQWLGVAATALDVPAEICIRRFHTQTLAATREKLGPIAFATAWAEGERLTLEEAVQLALTETIVT